MINQRLLAAFEALQVDRAMRAETIARRVGAIADRAARSLARDLIAATNRDRAAVEIADSLASMQATTLAELRSSLPKLATWSHRETVRIYARVIPRRWFRKINPAVILIGEDDPGSGGSLADSSIQIPLGPGATADNSTEPIAGQPLTDDEWQSWVERNVFPPLDATTIDAIVRSPIAGITWEQRIMSLSRLVDPAQVAAKVVAKFAEGANVRQIYKEILPLVDGGIKASAMRIARTESMRIANAAQRASYADLGDLAIGIQIHATLDQRTRPHHGLRHGTVFYFDGRSPSIDIAPDLPDEPNCRCGDVVVMSTPAEIEADPQLRAEFQRLGAAAIPDPESYEKWFRQSGEAERIIAMGKRRYNAIKAKWSGIREPNYFDFVDGDTGKLMPVKSLLNETDNQRAERQRKLGELISSRSELIAQITAKGFI
jgi:SPP1 gp7 family putative phage head morphogenesis protein